MQSNKSILNHHFEVRLSNIIIFNLKCLCENLIFTRLITMENNAQQLKIKEGQKQLKDLEDLRVKIETDLSSLRSERTKHCNVMLNYWKLVVLKICKITEWGNCLFLFSTIYSCTTCIHLSKYPSVHLIHLCIHLFIHASIHTPTICPCTHQSIYWSIQSPIYPLIHVSIHLSIYLSI